MNGLYSLSILFNVLPALPMKNAMRNQVHQFLKEAKDEEEGMLVGILMTMSHLLSIWKRKGIEFKHEDFLLLCNLVQTNSTLNKSENWFPICLPGIDG